MLGKREWRIRAVSRRRYNKVPMKPKVLPTPWWRGSKRDTKTKEVVREDQNELGFQWLEKCFKRLKGSISFLFCLIYCTIVHDQVLFSQLRVLHVSFFLIFFGVLLLFFLFLFNFTFYLSFYMKLEVNVHSLKLKYNLYHICRLHEEKTRPKVGGKAKI